MLITVLAAAISAGIATAAPWALQSRSRWAMAWLVTGVFAVMEMWLAEYRLGMAEAWKYAYYRDTGTLQRKLQQLRLELPQRASIGRDSDFPSVAWRSEPPRVLIQFLAAASPFVRRKPLDPMKSRGANRVASGESCNILPTAPQTDQSVSLAQLQPLYGQTGYTLLGDPQGDLIRPVHNYQNQAVPTPKKSG